MFQAVLKNSRIKYGKKFLEFLKSPVQLLDKTRDVVVNVAGDLLVMRRHWGGHIMGVEGSMGQDMNQLDDLPMLDAVIGLLHGQVLSVGSLDDPPVVDILVCVAGDLLLVR